MTLTEGKGLLKKEKGGGNTKFSNVALVHLFPTPLMKKINNYTNPVAYLSAIKFP